MWNWYLSLRRGLGAGMDGLNTLTWPALESWARLKKITLDPSEVDLLFAIDVAFRNPEPPGEA